MVKKPCRRCKKPSTVLSGRPEEVLREGVQGRLGQGRQHLAAARLQDHRHAQQAGVLPELQGKDSKALEGSKKPSGVTKKPSERSKKPNGKFLKCSEESLGGS